MQCHLVFAETEHLRDERLGRLRVLGRRPDDAVVARHMRDRVRHFHRHVRVMRHEIVGRNAMRRRLQRRGYIALPAHHSPRLLRCRFQFGAVGRRVVAGVRPEIPVDLELVPPLLRRPGIARDDRDAAERVEARRDRGGFDLDDLFHTRHRERVLRIEGFRAAAINRAALDRDVLDPGNDHVDAVGRPPAHDVVEVDDRHRLADVTPRARRLEAKLHVVGRRQRQVGRDLDKIAEAEAPSSGLVHDRMVLRVARGGIDVPRARRRFLEQLPRDRAGLAQRLVELPHAARAVGVLVTVFDVGITLDDLDARPIGVELVGQHHRKAGLDAGAHFGAVGNNRHHPGFFDADIDVRGELGFRGCPGGKAAEADVEAEHQPGAKAQAAKDVTPAEIFDCHAPDSAAALIAARMRWYVPQRQTLPDIASVICWSVGFGVSFSRAAACMI